MNRMDHANIIISVIVVLCIAAGVTAYGLTNPDNAFSDLAGFTPSADSLASAGNGLETIPPKLLIQIVLVVLQMANPVPILVLMLQILDLSNGGSSGTSSGRNLAMVDIVLQLMETPDQELIPEVEVEGSGSGSGRFWSGTTSHINSTKAIEIANEHVEEEGCSVSAAVWKDNDWYCYDMIKLEIL